MPRAKARKKVILEVPEIEHQRIDLLSVKAHNILEELHLRFSAIEDCDDASVYYDEALDNLNTAKLDMKDAIDSVYNAKKTVENAEKEVKGQFQNVIKSRMNIKSLSLKLASLIDKMDKPPKKKKRKKRTIARLITPVPYELDALESRAD